MEHNQASGQQFSTVIVPKTRILDFHLKELVRYKDLIFLFVKRSFVTKYKQTVLGPSWALIQPLISTLVFTFVFGQIAGLAPGGVPSFLFYMSGNIAWGYFSGCLNSTANTFTGNAGIFGKVYFPRLVTPISTVLSQLITFGIQFFLFLIFLVIFWIKGDVHPTMYILMLPILLLHMALLSLGVGIIISSMTTKYRDLQMLVGFGVSLWMYGTPVAYDIAIVPEKYMSLYMLNPMTPVINAFRKAFLGIGSFDLPHYLISWGVTLVVVTIGIMLFNRVEKTFMDTV